MSGLREVSLVGNPDLVAGGFLGRPDKPQPRAHPAQAPSPTGALAAHGRRL